MSLIDHLSLGVTDIQEAVAFYDAVLETVGCSRLAMGHGFACYGHQRVEFLLLMPFDDQEATAGNGTHIGFAAESRQAVQAFHQAGLEAGGKDEGAPGVREAYPMSDVYAAYVRDPFGNKIEVIHKGFSCNRDEVAT